MKRGGRGNLSKDLYVFSPGETVVDPTASSFYTAQARYWDVRRQAFRAAWERNPRTGVQRADNMTDSLQGPSCSPPPQNRANSALARFFHL